MVVSRLNVEDRPVERYVILLRGLMPTGKNKVLMAPLRAALEGSGLMDVHTYIQSGNILATSALGQADLEQHVHVVIADSFGGDIPVLARTVAQFRTIVANIPFSHSDPASLYVTLLASRPDSRVVEEFLAPGYDPDVVAVIGDVVYLRCASSHRASKVTNTVIERKLKVAATTRVSTTIARLAALSGEQPAGAAEKTHAATADSAE